MSGRQWLADLTAKWGESRINQPPTLLRGSEGTYERECWVWFPHDGINHNLALDQHRDSTRPHWVIRANGCAGRLTLALDGPHEPVPAVIRQALILAGMLP